ncbi:homoprotocatechuate degradation operon regulator HpaR [Rhizobium cremeum]|uniref:homoprotocatechuate degradation operon regulator HpaR n=1 Tax=Rhizobium cremeum TaxID=2813827 RepID=UPI000DD5F1EF|nr:homoprotocatechuate degradation operon regulator HpaR [Rhizobium cremeum]MCJ7994140.1 homoprotocatechuate degradation operon regulator HpaR [Rhizobium cremeum]MCJ7999198.1 homoprotocatechuate degradation operon regulator HpaR [Rhizobium cremeum]
MVDKYGEGDEGQRDGGAGTQRLRLRHFSRSMPMLLLRARESVMKHFRNALRMYDITEQQWRILRALVSVKEIEVTELARATFLLGPSLSRILKELEGRHLIERHPDENDLRRARISISAAGLELIEKMTRHSDEIYSEIIHAYGAERMRDLQKLLEELEGAMAQVDVSEVDAAAGFVADD